MTDTSIEWTDATWNPVAGCSVESSGCTNCYAMQMAYRLQAMGVKKYYGLTRKSGNKTVWTGKIRLDTKSLQAPVKWKNPRQIFVNSMSDLFHEQVPFDFVAKIWDVMKSTPRHQYQILTKRPERMADYISMANAAPLDNVWLGTSVENSSTVMRINILRTIPAAIRFISFEPLIGPVGPVNLENIHWAIVGGESGPRARPIEEHWIDEIHDQCIDYNTAFFFKQWGTWGHDNKRRSKKENGREYRGRHWDQMPVTPHSKHRPQIFSPH